MVRQIIYKSRGPRKLLDLNRIAKIDWKLQSGFFLFFFYLFFYQQSLNGNGQQFYQFQQSERSPLTFTFVSFTDSSYTTPMETYTSALYLCARNADVYYPGQCYNTTYGYAWVGHLRFSFSSQGIYILQTVKKHGTHKNSLKSTKGVIRSRKSTKDGHYNGKKKEDTNGKQWSTKHYTEN